MMRALCYVCHDKDQARMHLSEARRILGVLKRYESMRCRDQKLTMQEQRKMRSIIAETHLHFQCGRCSEVNTNELRMIEENLKEAAYKLYCFYNENPDYIGEAHDVYRYLCGHYPNLARLYTRIRKKEE